MANVSRYVLGLLFCGILACLFIPVSAESVSFGYQPDPIQFSETANSYILNNSELEIEFFKDTLGYNQYRNARNGSVLIYDTRVWVDYLGPADKWKPAGIAQTTSYKQIYKGYEVTRHYTGIQADYDVVYVWVENRPCKHTIYITGKVEEDFQVSESYDGVVGNSKIEKKNVYAGDNHNLIISIQDVIKSFGNDSVVVTESISANGKKFDYTFGSWELNFSDMANNSHKIQIDPSVTFNGSNSWAGTSGTMVINPNDNTLENDLENDGYEHRYDRGEKDWNLTAPVDGVKVGTSDWTELGYTLNGESYMKIDGALLDPDKLTIVTEYNQTSVGMVFAHRSETVRLIQIYGSSTTTGTLHYRGSGNTLQTLNVNTIQNQKYIIGVFNNSGDERVYSNKTIGDSRTDDYSAQTFTATKDTIGAHYSTAYIDGFVGTIFQILLYNNSIFNSTQINNTVDGYHKSSQYRQIDNAQDAGVNKVWKFGEVLGIDPSANTSLSLWINGSDDNVTFNGWEQVNSSFNAGDNVTIGIPYEYLYAKFKVYSNTTYQPETNSISNITMISDTLSLYPPQNLTNITEQTQICFNWDDDASADKWNISQRIPSIPYTDVIIVLDGVKDAEFTDRAHTWILDSPNPTGTNGDKESISWIRNTTTVSGYADGGDNDVLPNDDSFTVMWDMTANNLSTDDRQFILSESGTVTAKRWGGAAWLPQATNAVGVVIGAGVVGDIQYEMQIPVSELTNFNNGSTIKMAMAREDTSQNPDVTKYYPKTLINDTDATIWTSINLSAECKFTFLGNTTLSNYTVTGLTPFTWYRHRFSTINGSTKSSFVYSNDITEDSSQYIVSGYILTESGSPIPGADVWSVCDCGCVCEVNISNATGYYQGTCFYNGTYTIYAIATDYLQNSTVVIVNGANQSNQNITLSDEPVNGWTSIVDSVAWGISVAQYLVSNIGIVITTAFSLICILILAMLIGAALSVTKLIYR